MKEFIEIYQQHQVEIESFLMNTLKDYEFNYEEGSHSLKENFNSFPSMELVYITDLNYKQITPNIYRKNFDESANHKNRTYLIKKVFQKENQFSISEPYLSGATGNICITVMKKEKGKYVFIDFALDTLLGRLGLIELHPAFNKFTKKFYQFIGFSLIFFAFLAILYAFYSFIIHFIDSGFTLDTFFKPIVSITLGLAIFDLGKTILEREVYFKSYGKHTEDAMVLTKFSIAIIIALSIEALMVVFKITLHDYTQMIQALYLILGVGVIVVSLGIYTYLTKKIE